MTYSVSTAGPYFTSGEIRFSALRDTFRGTGTQIRASELLRRTTLGVEQTDPVVPDATENTSIATSTNWATSQFRNSIKYYNITQSGTNENVIVQNLTWNDNLNKTIRKVLYITGTIGATLSSTDALTLGADSYNLTMSISGSIYGYGGAGGSNGAGGSQACGVWPGANSGLGANGAAGTDAITISSSGRVIINIESNGKVFGGGGGGSGGRGGFNGQDSVCAYYTYYYTGYACGSVPGCGSDDQITYENGGGCNCSTSGKGSKATTTCYNSLYRSYCRRTIYYEVCGGAGGAGGDGAAGRGYNNLSNSLSGAGGSGGQDRSCPDPNIGYAAGGVGNTGGTGERGGNGGDWGESGGSTSGRNGGLGGRSVRGSIYTVQGSIGSDNIKGVYS